MVMRTNEDQSEVFYVIYTIRDGWKQRHHENGPHATEKKAEQAMQKLREQHGPAAWVRGRIEGRAS